MGELTGIWKQIIYGRIDRNVEADYIWANWPECGSRLYMGEMTGMWKLIIYGRIDRNVEADYIWAN